MSKPTLLAELMAQPWAMEPARLAAFLADVECAQGMLAAEGMVPTDEEQGAKPALNVRDGVAHIAIDGPMLKRVSPMLKMFGVRATSTADVGVDIDRALSDPAVKSIMLDIDSPGGLVSGVPELADKIAAADQVKPVRAHASDMAASAAYWVGSQARSLSANRSAMVGSIGVYNVLMDSSAAAAKQGVKVNVVSSAPLKGAGVNGSIVTDAQLADSQRLVNDYAGMFNSAVCRGRRMAEASPVATGQVWLAEDAQSRGLVDCVCSAEQAHLCAAEGYNQHPYGQPTVAINIKSQVAMTAEASKAIVREVAKHFEQNAEAIPAKAQTDAPISGAVENDMDPKTGTAGTPAISEEELKALKIKGAKADALEAQMLAVQGSALLEKYADRIAPAALPAMRKMVEACGSDLAVAEKALADMPKIARSERASSNAPADGAPAHVASVVSEGDRQLMKACGTDDVQRLRYLEALAEDVDHVNKEQKLVLKDGRAMTIEAFKKLRGFAVVLAVCLFGATVNAGALAGARQTTCKGAGDTVAYLMTASQTVYAGSLVMMVNAGTVQAAAASASNEGVVGVAQETKTSAASGSYWLRVSSRVICDFAATSIAQTAVGELMYATNDQTVDETQGANEPVAGILVQYTSSTRGWILIDGAISMGRVNTITDPVTMTGDITTSGGAGALTFTDTASSVVVRANDTTALLIGPAAQPGLITIDSGTATETVVINGTTTVSAFEVAVGTVTIAEDVTISGGASAITLDNTASSIVLNDNDSTALVVGSTDTLSILTIDTTDATPGVIVTGYLKSSAGLVTPALEANLTAGACTAGTWKVDNTTTRELCRCNDAGSAYDCISVTTANGPTD